MPSSLARRYFFKLVANFASVPVYLLMEAILPRALGPASYGNYNFVITFFQQFSGFLDMGTSTCFYNLFSRFQKRVSLLAFYGRITLLVLALMCLATVFLFIPGLGELVMPDVPSYFAPLGAFWAFLAWLARVMRSANDALGETIPSEVWRAEISLLAVLILMALFLADVLSVQVLFLQQYFFWGACCLAYWHVTAKCLRLNGLRLSWHLSKKTRKAYCCRFFNYSHPLFVQAFLSFLMLACERWLLQWFDGSAQQGFYALCQKVGIACFLFVSAMTPLLMREFSIAWGKKDLAGMGAILSRFAPMLYVLAAYFSCFTLAEGKIIVAWFGGADFAAAILPVQIMALYPVHQAYGQIAGSVFHAAGKTHILRNLTLAECVYGLALAWFFIAPAGLGGLNLGATGLAMKTVIVQFISVNIYLWLASRFISFPFGKNLCHQGGVIVLFILLAFTSKELSILIGVESNVTRFLISGIFYSFLCLLVCALFPQILGFSRKYFRELLIRFIKRK